MRIALVVTGGVDRSGRERVIPALLWLIERVAREHELFVYVLRYQERPCTYPLLGATVRDLGRPAGVVRQHAALLRELRRDGPFDVIHGYWAMPAGLAAALAARRLGAPSVVTLDSGEFTAVSDIGYGVQRSWRGRVAVAATLRLARRLTVCTRYMHQLAMRHRADPVVVPLGVDTSLFPRRTPGTLADGPPWRLIHVASLNPVKDQHTLIDALAQLRTRVPDVHLDIVGEDTMSGAIHAYAARRGRDSHVTFHGFVPADQLAALYHRAHLAVLSSRHEAAGVVVLEAAACGIPTVGSAVGYIADWMPDRAVGVRPADPMALAAGIEALIADPSRRDRLAAAAHQWTAAHDADWTAAALLRIYEDVRRR